MDRKLPPRAFGDYPGPYPEFEGLYKMPYPNLKKFKKNQTII